MIVSSLPDISFALIFSVLESHGVVERTGIVAFSLYTQMSTQQAWTLMHHAIKCGDCGSGSSSDVLTRRLCGSRHGRETRLRCSIHRHEGYPATQPTTELMLWRGGSGGMVLNEEVLLIDYAGLDRRAILHDGVRVLSL